MQDAKALLDQFLGQSSGQGGGQSGRGQGSGFSLDSMLSGKGGLATGAIAGGLAGLLLGGKKPRKIAKSALKVGGIALVGGLAYKAWNDWQANKAPAPAAPAPQPERLQAPAETPFVPDNEAEAENLSRALIRAMIAAAKADGHVTDEERGRIAEQLGALELSGDDRAFINDELSKPLNVGEVADAARTPEQAAEIYAASLLVIDPDGAAERGYLAMLAARLKLEPGLVEHLHASTASVVETDPTWEMVREK